MSSALTRFVGGTLVFFLAFLSLAIAAEVVVEGRAPIRNGDIGEARELASRRALAQAVEMHSARVSAQTLFHDGNVMESAQVSSSGCTENSKLLTETVGESEISVRLQVMVREAGACQQSCKQSTVNRVLIAGFPVEHPEQILPTENSWLTNLTPVELARWVGKRRQVLVAFDAKAFLHGTPTRAPEPNLSPTDVESPFVTLARRHRAQYVVAGVYRDFSIRSNRFYGQTRRIELEVYIHDGVNGAVLDSKVFAGTAEGHVTLHPKPAVGTPEFYASDLGRPWGRIMNDVADWVIDKATCLPFVTRVLKTEGTKIYLDAGADSGLSLGDTLVLHTWRTPPNPVRDEADLPLGQEKFSRVTASIKHRYPEFSIAELVEAGHSIKIAPGDLLYAK